MTVNNKDRRGIAYTTTVNYNDRRGIAKKSEYTTTVNYKDRRGILIRPYHDGF